MSRWWSSWRWQWRFWKLIRLSSTSASSPSCCTSVAATGGGHGGKRASNASTRSTTSSIPHCTHSSVVSVFAWFLVNNSVIACIMSLNSLHLTHSSSSSICGGFFGDMVNRSKQERAQDGYHEANKKNGNRTWNHTLPQVSYPTLTSVLLTL
jgi:hypothetical protein